MKYRNTSRNGALLYLLNFVTLGLFFVFFFIRIRREIGMIGRKKGIPFPVAWLLGWITLFIVPLIWFCNRAEELKIAHEALGLKGKPVDFTYMFCWLVFGSFIIIGPFVAFHRFFNTLNRIEAAVNVAVAPKEVKPAKKPEAKEEGKKPEDTELPVSNADKPLKLRTPVVRFDPKYADVQGEYWCMKIDGKFYYFKSQAEAIAFARRVAYDRGVNISVLGKDELGIGRKIPGAGKYLKVGSSEAKAAPKAAPVAAEAPVVEEAPVAVEVVPEEPSVPVAA